MNLNPFKYFSECQSFRISQIRYFFDMLKVTKHPYFNKLLIQYKQNILHHLQKFWNDRAGRIIFFTK